MIVVKTKPLSDISKMLEDYDRILIVGCDGCAGIYQVGGIKQAEMMSRLVSMTKQIKEGENPSVKACTVLRQCDRRIVASSLRETAKDYDAILSLACGVGVQTLADVFNGKPVIPANDTLFIGSQDRELGVHHEMCKACGDCILFETGGICPITRCAKHLLNGPCGGVFHGKCEVDRTRDCAWILIYQRLKRMGKLENFVKFRLPKDFSYLAGQRTS